MESHYWGELGNTCRVSYNEYVTVVRRQLHLQGADDDEDRWLHLVLQSVGGSQH